ncbi:MAG TPA: transposase [Nevskiaceae bacterium]|nr:transposase [Nevskiaceae bacterium]
MARHPRYRIAGLAQHLVQRGNNRVDTFRSAGDFHFYLECVAAAADRCRCAIHAYVLMSNHVHLLATPEEPEGLSEMMQSVGRRFVRYFNDRYVRTGTLWEGRFKAVPVDSERYLAACHRYIESNPVRAGVVSHPADYWWSSYRSNALGNPDRLVSPHPWYAALGTTANDRQRAYGSLFDDELAESTLDELRHGINRSWVSGSDPFVEKVRVAAGRPCRPAPRGGRRPGAGRPLEAAEGKEENQLNLTPLISG